MSDDNRLSRILRSIERLPAFLRTRARSMAIGRVVPFVGTASIRAEQMTHERVVFTIANRRPVQNHIKGVHAAATALLAETATGMALGMHVPDSALPLLKSMRVDYVRRAKGDLRAEAWLDPADIQRVRAQPKGDVTVHVTVTDATGAEPVHCEMVWAWIPARR